MSRPSCATASSAKLDLHRLGPLFQRQADDDREADLHGMAIKLLGVEGEKVLESEKEAPTQDFVLVDQPVFFIRDLADYVPFSEQVFRLRRGPSWWMPVVVVFRAFMLGDRPGVSSWG